MSRRPTAEPPCPSGTAFGLAAPPRLRMPPGIGGDRREGRLRRSGGAAAAVRRALARWDWYETGVVVLMGASALAAAACLAAGR